MRDGKWGGWDLMHKSAWFSQCSYRVMLHLLEVVSVDDLKRSYMLTSICYDTRCAGNIEVDM